jgi:rRNA-processing protein FCF1
MKQVLLDTNFILTCIKQKIDLFENLLEEGYSIIIPENVINELEKLKKVSALKLLENEKENFKRISLPGKNVDNSIMNYAKENKSIIIATLDRELQKRIRNKKMVIRDRRKLEIL